MVADAEPLVPMHNTRDFWELKCVRLFEPNRVQPEALLESCLSLVEDCGVWGAGGLAGLLEDAVEVLGGCWVA